MDRWTRLNGSKPLQVNAKCDVVMKLSVFGTVTDTHTHKAKPIDPRYTGCKEDKLCKVKHFKSFLKYIHRHRRAVCP